VATLMDRRLEHAKPNLKPGTIQRYREAIKIYIKPHLGSAKLHELDALTVQTTYSTWLREGTSPTTVNLAHNVLSSAFKRAVKWQLLRHNIIRDVDSPRIEAKEEVEVWTPDEVCALLPAA
jgi:site-specific recombinase XerD